ncbi:helix-turn-helix domain-containing protein [Nocardiopsis sp. CC223A]|uniref:helix-turn-helix domain-containing protein n=1 Tax=Nocardiopsis sp. CC223A TaxID=3044051 RepID=UPI00278BE7E1|nr:helix-turn-helix transcriptional regulator [Nocardiopsis sp. CC223A]
MLRPSTSRPSPLRQARLDRGATLEQVCADLDAASPDGSSGVTPSMLSGWELGRHTTTRRYRELLAAHYDRPAAELFAHQDQRTTGDEPPRLLTDPRELRGAMVDVVQGADEFLAVTGSRSRDLTYLEAIETTLAARPALVHYRLLFGPPRTPVLTAHLYRLLELRDPHDRSLGMKTLHIGLIDADLPERFFVTSEKAAVVPLPSLTSVYGFDSGVVLGAQTAERLVDHARQGYAAATRIETTAALQTLTSTPPRQETA